MFPKLFLWNLRKITIFNSLNSVSSNNRIKPFLNFIDEDYKSILQVESQKKYGLLPKYIVEKQEGPPHDREFHVSVFINKIKHGNSKGKSKKDAENKSAKKALRKIKSFV